MFLVSKVIFLLGMVFCSSEIVFFGQKGDSLSQRKYFLDEKVFSCPKNVFLHPLATSNTIILKMISWNSRIIQKISRKFGLK